MSRMYTRKQIVCSMYTCVLSGKVNVILVYIIVGVVLLNVPCLVYRTLVMNQSNISLMCSI